MRHKYPTPAFVLARTPLGEANALITLLTREVGVVRARAQGLRRPGAKLAPALVTFARSEVVLVRGAEGWRVTGATLRENWFLGLSRAARARAARVAHLLTRRAPEESGDPRHYELLEEHFEALRTTPEALHDSAECRAVLALLASLGLDEGALPALEELATDRSPYIARINRGIALSGL